MRKTKEEIKEAVRKHTGFLYGTVIDEMPYKADIDSVVDVVFRDKYCDGKLETRKYNFYFRVDLCNKNILSS